MNPFLGVFFHWLGGLASGSFYVPYKGVRKWSWEIYWLVGGFFSWIICPCLLASLLTNDVFGVLRQQSAGTLWWTYFFGAMWGFGGLTFGLTMRYLGMSLGMGVALGLLRGLRHAVAADLQVVHPEHPGGGNASARSRRRCPGKITLLGVFVCLAGHRRGCLRGLDQGTRDARRRKEEGDRRIQLRQGHHGGDVLRRS